MEMFIKIGIILFNPAIGCTAGGAWGCRLSHPAYAAQLDLYQTWRNSRLEKKKTKFSFKQRNSGQEGDCCAVLADAELPGVSRAGPCCLQDEECQVAAITHARDQHIIALWYPTLRCTARPAAATPPELFPHLPSRSFYHSN